MPLDEAPQHLHKAVSSHPSSQLGVAQTSLSAPAEPHAGSGHHRLTRALEPEYDAVSTRPTNHAMWKGHSGNPTDSGKVCWHSAGPQQCAHPANLVQMGIVSYYSTMRD